MVSFMNPWAFWLVVPVSLLFLLLRREKESASPLHPSIVIASSSGGRFVRSLQTGALILMVVALARPVLQSVSETETISAEPVYLALDLSASMRATDRKPSRLAYSEEVIRTLLQKDSVHPYGLFGFTTNTLILSPATMDHRLVETALLSINPDFIITRGTDIGALVESVADLPQERKRLVIFSDGGDEHDLSDAIRLCREKKITIYGVAAATESGASIPKKGEGFIRDEEGRLVISMQNPSLAQLAESTGGLFIDSDSAEDAAESLLQALSDDEILSSRAVRVETEELFWIPLLAAFVLYLLSVVEIPFKRGVVPLLVIAVGAMPTDAGVLELLKLQKGYDLYHNGDFNRSLATFKAVKEPSLQRSFAEASALYKVGAYKESARILSSIRSEDPAVKAAIYYDLGNCAVKIDRYKRAQKLYIKSLQLKPDADTLENLAATLFLKDRKKRLESRSAKMSPKSSRVSSGTKRDGSGKKRESKGSGATGGGGKSARKSPENRSVSATQGILRHPIGSKAYELINKGYVNERRPW